MKNIENQIRQQLENREIPVSENSWEKLSAMMDEVPETSGRTRAYGNVQMKGWWMFSAAASVAILISFFALNPFEKKEIPEATVVSSHKNLQQKPVQENETFPDEISTEIADTGADMESVKPENKKVKTKLNSNQKERIIVQDKMEIAENQVEEPRIPISPEIRMNIPEPQPVQEMTSNKVQETKPKPEKKNGKYVDADMLLYSVENNKAISESKDNTKLVIIDFNK